MKKKIDKNKQTNIAEIEAVVSPLASVLRIIRDERILTAIVGL